MALSSTKAIKTYMEQDPHGRKVDAKEIIAFKGSMPVSEYAKLGAQAAAALGEELETAEAA